MKHCDTIKLPNKFNYNAYASVYFYLGKNTGSYFSILVVSVEFVWRQRSYVFFVRSFGYALFLYSKNRKGDENMRIKRIASAFLSSAMFISACALGVSALEENTTVIFGDINLDNAVSIIDSTELQKYLANMVSLDKLTEIDENLLDINNDGAVNVEDATELQKHLADLQADEKIEKVAYIWHEPEVVHHDAVTHEEPVYEWVGYNICNQCGARLDGNPVLHYVDNDYCISYHSAKEKVQTGTTTVVDEPAYDDIIKNGYWEYMF